MRIAIIGSAPSSASLAPYDDETWQIWGCSPGAQPQVRRVDVWFELHRWGQDWLTREYREWLAKQPKVYVFDEAIKSEVKTAVSYPWRDMVSEFGEFFFTSTPAWMLAMALSTPEVKEIGLWGIDMAAVGEYDAQKPGCLFFLHTARQRGIKVTTPAESDLLRPPGLYGLNELSPKMVKLAARGKELRMRRAAIEDQIENLKKESIFIAGCLDDHEYHVRTWGD